MMLSASGEHDVRKPQILWDPTDEGITSGRTVKFKHFSLSSRNSSKLLHQWTIEAEESFNLVQTSMLV
jgi:hypothetical protein